MTLKILATGCLIFFFTSNRFDFKNIRNQIHDTKRAITCSKVTSTGNSLKYVHNRTIFFSEGFEDSEFANRGWYDNTFRTTTSESYSGASSAEFHFFKGATSPESGGSIRRLFDESNSIYISFRIKYSDNWQEQLGGYGHHEIHLLTNEDGPYTGPAFTHLTLYLENHDLEPVLSLQDGKNIDQAQAGRNLVGITENRSIAGCNGDSDSLGHSTCYKRDGRHWNGKIFFSGSQYIKPGQWHHVEVYFRLNTISDGTGQADGLIKYWLDGALIIDHTNVILRTGAHEKMCFNQFIVAPFMGNGAPNDQSFWIDDLIVASKPLN